MLVATDCLSEGVNLQEHLHAVVHYDLSWNPTRHEQREGRVDRFGQPRPVVRATLMYGENNPVDGAVLEVILRKAERIRKELGVPVPVPGRGAYPDPGPDQGGVAAPSRRARPTGEGQQLELFEAQWRSAAEKAKANRTIFAQRRLKPEDVLPEWHKSLAAIGGRDASSASPTAPSPGSARGWSPCGAGSRLPLTPARGTAGAAGVGGPHGDPRSTSATQRRLRAARCSAATPWWPCLPRPSWSGA